MIPTPHLISRAPGICRWCDALAAYSLRHMAAYCDVCDVWLQLRCEDLECGYCRDRPVVPSARAETDELPIGPG